MTATSAPKTNDKKAKAFEIFEANKDKKSSDIARLIQAELGITLANAQYYVTRVFKKWYNNPARSRVYFLWKLY